MSLPRTSLVVLNDVYIQSHLLVYGAMLQEFPFLIATKNAVDALGTCAKCQKPAKKAIAEKALNDAKQAIANLSDSQKVRFKELLNTEAVRVQWRVQVGSEVDRGRTQF